MHRQKITSLTIKQKGLLFVFSQSCPMHRTWVDILKFTVPFFLPLLLRLLLLKQQQEQQEQQEQRRR